MTKAEASPSIDYTKEGWSFQLFADQEFARDPRRYYEELRQSAPCRDDMVIPGQNPSVVFTRHEDVEYVLRNPQLFSSQFGEATGGIGNDRPLIPLQIDPPHHKKYRVLLDPYGGQSRRPRAGARVGHGTDARWPETPGAGR